MIGNLNKRSSKKWLKIKTKLQDNGLAIADEPTHMLALANAGLGNEVNVNLITKLFEPFGEIKSIKSYTSKSYALLSYTSIDSATESMKHLQGYVVKKSCNQHATLFLYFLRVFPTDEADGSNLPVNDLPAGLFRIDDFVSVDEEQEITQRIENDLINCSEEHIQESLKHRTVLHYGFKFRYGSNDVNCLKPLSEDLPDFVKNILDRIVSTGHVTDKPDQLTINIYNPGDGIPHHIDNPEAFDTGIATISLGSQTVMEMKSPCGAKVEVLLKPRTLVVFTGDSRYTWTHGIQQKKTDVLFDEITSKGIIVKRSRRISLTFRKVLLKQKSASINEYCSVPSEETAALSLEKKFVQGVYNNIAEHFSSTREKPWPRVVQFLKSLNPGSLILDIGCGSGRYYNTCPEHFMLGCDSSSSLIDICSQKQYPAFVCDGLNVPVRSSSFDACICIAVIHHYSTSERRFSAIKEILRILRKHGIALIYVWAFEQRFKDVDSNYLKKSSSENVTNNLYCKLSESLEDNSDKVEKERSLIVHKNKTSFAQQDLLVPWKKKNTSTDKTEDTFYRFYHVFKENELIKLCTNLSECTVVNSYYDSGNWAVVLRKLCNNYERVLLSPADKQRSLNDCCPTKENSNMDSITMFNRSSASLLPEIDEQPFPNFCRESFVCFGTFECDAEEIVGLFIELVVEKIFNSFTLCHKYWHGKFPAAEGLVHKHLLMQLAFERH